MGLKDPNTLILKTNSMEPGTRNPSMWVLEPSEQWLQQQAETTSDPGFRAKQMRSIDG